jgi:uncharacterized repeat protein (TIGR01451 family)
LKRFLLVASLVSLTIPVRAAVLYFDDLQQFPSGTSLTSTNYLPNIGASAEIQTNDDGLASATVVASNMLGSTRAFINRPGNTYEHRYRGEPTAVISTQAVTLSWKLWIEAVKTPAATLGGFVVDLVTTNSFIDVSGTNYDHNPVMIFNDAGQIMVFTNNVMNPNPAAVLASVRQIGSWSSQAGKVMTNVLVLDYPNHILSFALNGTTLTNMPIPQIFTNLFDSAHLSVFEGFANVGTFSSTGNRFALDDVQVNAGPASTNRDVSSYLTGAKGQLFEQLTAGAPVQSTTGFAFQADSNGTTTNSILSVSDQIPGGAIKTLIKECPDCNGFSFSEQFTSKSALDAAYNSGTYTLTIVTADQGVLQPALNLPGDNYPTTPQIQNFAAAQTVEPSTNFVVRWNTFTGGGATDLINFDIRDMQGNFVFSSPDSSDPTHLDGTATSFTIPAGTLQPGMNYFGDVLFAKVTTQDTNSIHGAVGNTGFFKLTQFPIATAAAPGLSCSLAPAHATNDVLTSHTVTATITSNNAPSEGLVVNFSVIAGPNLGNTGTDTTDAAGHASFSYSSSVTGTDTIQAASSSTTCTATKVWLAVNIPPVAVCRNVTTNAGLNCTANVPASAVDDGSSDADGQIVSRVLSPGGPYALGTNAVTLTVTDNRGATNSCTATITVVDTTPPTISCPADVNSVVAFGETNGVVNYPAATITDNCSVVSSNSVPASGSRFPLGTNVVTVTATDGSGNTNSCTFNVIVVQGVAQADLGVSGGSLVATASLNNTFSYTFIVTNKGPQAAVNAEFVDTLPAGLVYVSSTSSTGNLLLAAGKLTCDLNTFAAGSSASISLVVSATTAGVVCNIPTVESDTLDPVSADNSVSACATITINDLAVTAFKAPKKVTLSSSKPTVTGKFSVTVQNRSPHSETIRDLNALSNLVTIALSSLGTNECSTPVVQFVLPKKLPPLTIASGKSLKLAFTAVFNCATDPAASSKTENHADYEYLVTVHHEVLDGLLDSHTADDVCPHNALGVDPLNSKIKDTGCGTKQPDGDFAPVLTDVIDTRL